MCSRYVNKLILSRIANVRYFHFSPILVNQRNAKSIRSSIVPILIHSSSSLSAHLSKNNQTIRQRIIHEFKHYYQGFKLFHHETKTTFSLLRQISNGHQLTRKERKQVENHIEIKRIISNRNISVKPNIDRSISSRTIFRIYNCSIS